MKISTWNLMRPTSKTILRNDIFHNGIKSVSPDILILTETNLSINPGKEYFASSTPLLPTNTVKPTYKAGENRVTIYSKFPFGQHFETYDPLTAICSEVLTDLGPLIVYGTIMGVFGGKGKVFRDDFDRQKEDIAKLAVKNNICVAGDFNIAFSGFPYPSHDVIKEASDFFDNIKIDILTRGNVNSPDHIAISKSVMKNHTSEFSQIPFERKISDHSFVTVKLSS